MRLMFWKHKHRDQQLDEEIQSHLTLVAREEMESGRSPREAQLAARREFGNETIVREVTRDMWGWRWIENFLQDVRYGLRMLRKNPGFTAVAVLTLALGISANTAIFSLVDTVMLKVLPVQNPEELVQLATIQPQSDGEPNPYYTNPLWEQIRDSQDIFSSDFAWSDWTLNLAQGGAAQNVNASYVSGNYFNSLGVNPAAGRLLTASDDYRGCPGTAVLSYGFWQEHYGGGPNAVGSMLSLNAHPFQVVGVTSPGFFGVDVGHKFDVAIPICSEAIIHGKNTMLAMRSSWWIEIMGRPKAGISREQLNARLRVLSPGIFAATVPPNWKPDMQQKYLKRILNASPSATGISNLRRTYTQPLRMLMVVVGLVLLIACANIASLMLARSAARRKEIAVRLAMGASRFRLIRQLLTECILLSCAGAVLGVLFARWGCAVLVRLISTTRNPIFLQLTLDSRVLAFTAGVAILTGLLFGILPAFRSTHVSLASAMKGSQAEESESHSHSRPGRWIVASQVALSLVLMIVAGLFLRSFTNLLTLDAGFDRSNVLLVNSNFHNANIPPVQFDAMERQILDRLKALPGVISVSQSVLTPLSRNQWDNYLFVDGGGGPTGDDADAYLNYVSPGYFTTLRSPILAGRDFNAGDTAGAPFVGIVNETLARKFFPHTDPIGRYVHLEPEQGKPPDPIRIVGILKDAKYNSLRDETPPTAYFPFAQLNALTYGVIDNPVFEVRTTSPPATLAHAAEQAITGLNKAIDLNFGTLQQQVDDSLRQEQLLATLSGFFGGLALFLAMIGLYGVLAYMVTQRRKEIGIRMALGAGSSAILRLILRDVAILLAAGIAAGLGLSLWATRLVQTMLFELSARDTGTITLAIALLAVVALVAGYLPARRASRMDPNAILHDE
ncbi:MAG TPA: ABC transporter permease [Candidatus Acidoferrales bacterium]|nr:ABC transporter permease [Candidatus Acidoferrales bacterium]